MTTIAPTTPAPFFEEAFERIAAFAREHRARRRQRIALAHLLELDAARLDDLGINVHDVTEAMSAPRTGVLLLEDRRAQRATTWTPQRPMTV